MPVNLAKDKVRLGRYWTELFEVYLHCAGIQIWKTPLKGKK